MTFSTGGSFPSGAICFQNACAVESVLFIAALIATLISFLTSCSLIPCAFATSLIMFFNILPPMSCGDCLSLTVIVIPQPICRSPAILVESIIFFSSKKESPLIKANFRDLWCDLL